MSIEQTKKQRVKEHLLAGKSLTGWQLLNDFGCLAYRDVIYHLRNRGVPIKSRMVGATKHAIYWIAKEDIEIYLRNEQHAQSNIGGHAL